MGYMNYSTQKTKGIKMLNDKFINKLYIDDTDVQDDLLKGITILLIEKYLVKGN